MSQFFPSGGDEAAPLGELRIALQVDIPSDVRYIERVVEIVRSQCEAVLFAPRHCALNVPVALSEALSNAILYGNGENPLKHVRVRAEVNDARLILEVTDEGGGFDIARETSDPTSLENIEREDGRGLFLMQQLMDLVERFDDNGNVVRLTLNRA
jgi:serine/threonine-protein kinase RsbW